MNNKGQTLVIFIILIPIMFILFALIMDTGFMLIKRKTIKSNIEQTILYGLSSNEEEKEEKMIDLLKINLGDENIYDIKIDDKIKISIKGKYKTIFQNTFKDNYYSYNYSYIGYIKDGKYIIEKEG